MQKKSGKKSGLERKKNLVLVIFSSPNELTKNENAITRQIPNSKTINNLLKCQEINKQTIYL